MNDPNSKEHWDEKWETSSDSYLADHQVMYSVVRPFMKGQVIDLGCGNGFIGHDIGERYAGIDLSEEGIKQAKGYNSKANLVVGDARNTPFADRSADTVLLLAVVEHFLNYNAILLEAQRLCRGRIIMTLPYHSRGSEHYHPHFSIQKVVNTMSYLGEIVEYRLVAHPKGKWVLVVIEVE